MKIVGIDPGKNGSVVSIDSDNQCSLVVHKLQFDECNILDIFLLNNFLQKESPDCIYIEKIMGRGGTWGATQNFNFGMIYGQILLAVREAKIPFKMITPQSWQKVIHKGISKSIDSKKRTLIAYKNLFPDQPIPKGPKGGAADPNTIDAFLIAVYGTLDNYGKILKWRMI